MKSALELARHLEGPHEWGYRCLSEGTFIEDNAPFDAAIALQQENQVARVQSAKLMLAMERVEQLQDCVKKLLEERPYSPESATNPLVIRANSLVEPLDFIQMKSVSSVDPTSPVG